MQVPAESRYLEKGLESPEAGAASSGELPDVDAGS